MIPFQIVQMDPDAAKWLGFAKQQCKRIMDNGTKDFYREWPLGDATVKAKSYGGTVKLWLVSTGGDLIISNRFGAAIPPDGNYYIATDNIKYDSAIPALTLKKKGYPSVTTNRFTQGWSGLPNHRKSSWLVLNTPTFSVDSTTNHKLFSVTYVALKATGKTKTVNYDIDSILPGATTATFLNAAPLGPDTIAVFILSDPVLVTSKYIACSRGDGTFCEVTAVLGFSIAATQNAVWVVDGTVFQRINKVAGVLTATRTDIPSSASGAGGQLISVGLTSIGGIAGDAYSIRLFRIDENLNVATKTYSSSDIGSSIYSPQILSVSCTDSDVISNSYWSDNAAPFPIVGIRATLTSLITLTPLVNEGQMIDGGNLGDGLYGVCYYAGTLGYSYDYTIKAFDASGALQDTTETVHTDSIPSTVGIVGTSSKAVYVWDTGNIPTLRKFDRVTKKWGLVSPPAGSWGTRVPFVYATPDTDFVFQLLLSPTRTTITSASDPAFTVTLTGQWGDPSRIYYDAKTRTLVIGNQVAIINVGRTDMVFVPASAFIFKPPTTFDTSGNFIPAYQRPASNTQSAVFSYQQAESWGQLWDTQMSAMQPALPP